MARIFAKERGTGIPLILLHGFPFNHTIWNSFAEKLSKNFRVITPDLPGLGESTFNQKDLTIDAVADQLIDWMKSEKISRSVLIGHSLGGYVTLAMAAKAPELLSAIGLFHSTALADNMEKKESRNKVLDFITKNGVTSFTSNFIGPLFADHAHPAISTVRSIAIQASEKSVRDYTVAMRDRSDRTDVIKNFSKPILFIAGEKDGGIPVNSIKSQAEMSANAVLEILPGVAHMGMVENENQTVEIVKNFIETNGVTS